MKTFTNNFRVKFMLPPKQIKPDSISDKAFLLVPILYNFVYVFFYLVINKVHLVNTAEIQKDRISTKMTEEAKPKK